MRPDYFNCGFAMAYSQEWGCNGPYYHEWRSTESDAEEDARRLANSKIFNKTPNAYTGVVKHGKRFVAFVCPNDLRSLEIPNVIL